MTTGAGGAVRSLSWRAERRAPRWAVVSVVSVVSLLCLLPVAYMLWAQYLDTRENVGVRCAIDRVLPADVTLGDPVASAQGTWMPAGRRCAYVLQDGSTTTVQTGWDTTIVGLIASGLVIVAAPLLYRWASSVARRVWSFVPIAIVVLAWLLAISRSTRPIGG